MAAFGKSLFLLTNFAVIWLRYELENQGNVSICDIDSDYETNFAGWVLDRDRYLALNPLFFFEPVLIRLSWKIFRRKLLRIRINELSCFNFKLDSLLI